MTIEHHPTGPIRCEHCRHVHFTAVRYPHAVCLKCDNCHRLLLLPLHPNTVPYHLEATEKP